MEPKYKDLTFKSKEEFEKWLEKTATMKIKFEDDGQDFLEWWIDDRGEVLHSDLQARIWNGKMVDVENMTVGEFLPLQDGQCIIHRVIKVVYIKPIEVKAEKGDGND